MILCLPHGQPCHIGIKANPSVLRVRILDALRLRKCCFEVNLQNVLLLIEEIVGDIDAMCNKHVIAFQDDVAIQLYCCVCIEAIEDQDVF